MAPIVLESAAAVFVALMLVEYSLKVHAIECISCEYLDFTATGPSTVTDAAKNFTSQKNGSEECFLNENVTETCSVGNSCYSLLLTSTVDVSSSDAIGQVHIKYAKRGCADADAVSSCENKVNSDEVSTINSLTDSLKTIPGASYSETPTISCCLQNFCNSKTIQLITTISPIISTSESSSPTETSPPTDATTTDQAAHLAGSSFLLAVAIFAVQFFC